MPHVGVKGRMEGGDGCTVFGLSQQELQRMRDVAPTWGHRVGQDGHQIAQHPVSKKPEIQDETCRQSIAKNIASLGQSDLPQKAISGAVRKSSLSPLRRGTNEENIRNQSLTPTVEKTEKPERKKPDRLGSKPEDKAEYGIKGSTIDVKDLESIEENPPSPEKKIILNTNRSSEYNPLSFRNLEPLKKKDFVTTYSETIAKPAETAANAAVKKIGGVNCEMVCHPGNPRNCAEKQIYETHGANPEFVLAEYTAESTMANAGPVIRRQLPNAGKPLNICPVNLPPTHNACPQNDGRNQNVIPQGMMRNQKVRSPSPNPAIQRRKTVERIGTKPEDLAQYGINNRKIEVIDLNNFEEMPEEDVIEKRIILNTNDSSEDNPMSNRNLEPQEDLMARFGQSSRRRD